MSNYYSDPTANAAIGTVDHELAKMRKPDKEIRNLRQRGYITPENQKKLG